MGGVFNGFVREFAHTKLQNTSRSQIQANCDGDQDNKNYCPEQHVQELLFHHFVMTCQNLIPFILLKRENATHQQ